MNGKVLAYIRVSTVEQNEERQVVSLKKYKPDKTFTEKVSAKDTNRPELQKLLEFCREGDTIVIHDFSRLARNTRDLLDIVDKLNDKGVTLISNKENIDTSTASGKLMLTMIGAIAEFERANLLERQREGISIAKAKGLYKGRKPVEIEDKVFTEQYNRYMRREINKVEFAKVLKVSRPTLDKMIKEYRSHDQG
jgi:DNA invertase Pin-like site-specific DNA recombinase